VNDVKLRMTRNVHGFNEHPLDRYAELLVSVCGLYCIGTSGSWVFPTIKMTLLRRVGYLFDEGSCATIYWEEQFTGSSGHFWSVPLTTVGASF